VRREGEHADVGHLVDDEVRVVVGAEVDVLEVRAQFSEQEHLRIGDDRRVVVAHVQVDASRVRNVGHWKERGWMEGRKEKWKEGGSGNWKRRAQMI